MLDVHNDNDKTGYILRRRAIRPFCSNPGKVHWEVVKRIISYLAGTIAYGISFNGKLYQELSLTQTSLEIRTLEGQHQGSCSFGMVEPSHEEQTSKMCNALHYRGEIRRNM